MALPAEYQELQANLKEYEDQLQQLEELLLDEPDNADYHSLFREVQEAIALTQSALDEATGAGAPGPSDGDAAATDATGRKRKSRFESAAGADAAGSSALPTQVLDQIRSAKARSALEGKAPMGWAIGYPCSARLESVASGAWQPAQVTGVTPDGQYQIVWESNNAEGAATIRREDCKPRDSGAYAGVKGAPARKVVSQVNRDAYARYLRGESEAIPKWMEIRESDDDAARAKKRAALKALKKKRRFEQKDLESTKKANEWQSFQKGSKKKAGFMTGQRKASMFAVPDNDSGRVGVIGSGQGMTNASTKRTRLDF